MIFLNENPGLVEKLEAIKKLDGMLTKEQYEKEIAEIENQIAVIDKVLYEHRISGNMDEEKIKEAENERKDLFGEKFEMEQAIKKKAEAIGKLFDVVFNGNRNFFTPTVLEYGEVIGPDNERFYYELSTGEGLNIGVNTKPEKMYGVTVLSESGEKLRGPYSRSFRSLDEARKHLTRIGTGAVEAERNESKIPSALSDGKEQTQQPTGIKPQ